MSNYKRDLIMIADILDAKGLHKEADEIDKMIESTDTGSRAVSNFVDAFKLILNDVAQQEAMPSINQETVRDIYRLIDLVISYGRSSGFLGRSTDPEEYRKMQDRAYQLALGIIQYVDSITRLTNEANEATDGETREKIIGDLKEDKEMLAELTKEIEGLRTGKREEDLKTYNRFLEFFKEYTGREYQPYNV